MLIGLKIGLLFQLMEETSLDFLVYNPVMRRMLSMGFITELHQLESELIIINNKLDSEISFDDASINKDMDFLKERLRVDILMNPKSYYNREETDVIVNHVIDSFPLVTYSLLLFIVIVADEPSSFVIMFPFRVYPYVNV